MGDAGAPKKRRSVLDFVFINRCIACRARIGRDVFLCPTCASAYAEEKRDECGICGKRLASCACSNDYLKDHGIQKTIKVVHYLPDNEEFVGNLVLYHLKRDYLHSIHDFIAAELCEPIRALLPSHSDWAVAFVPRTGKQKRKFGFDQSYEVAKALAKQLSLPFVKALKRARKAKTQKTVVGVEHRRENVKGSFLPRKQVSLRGKRVLLFDDIVTTGATVAECARVLRRMGAKEVIVVAYGVTARYSNIKYEHEKNTRLPPAWQMR